MKGKRNIADFLGMAALMIEGAACDPGVQSRLAEFNYGPERMEALRALLEEVRALVAGQAMGYGMKHAASERVNDLRFAANERYRVTRRLAKIAVGADPEARSSLLLDDRRARSMADWLHQTSVFYDNLLRTPELLRKLNRFGFTDAKLRVEQELVAAARRADAEQKQSKGAAVAGTKERNARINELAAEISDLKTVALIALSHEQQTGLGLTGRAFAMR